MTGAPSEKDKRDTFVTHVPSPGPCTLCVENHSLHAAQHPSLVAVLLADAALGD